MIGLCCYCLSNVGMWARNYYCYLKNLTENYTEI